MMAVPIDACTEKAGTLRQCRQGVDHTNTQDPAQKAEKMIPDLGLVLGGIFSEWISTWVPDSAARRR